MQVLPAALAPLGEYRQFICWFAVPSTREPGKLDKFPVNPSNGEVHNAHDPAIWTDFATAARVAPGYNRGWGSGVGFVFTDQDPFAFLDADKCLMPNGQWSPVVHDLCSRLGAVACEVSQSGQGLHWFGRLSRPLEHGTKNVALGLELYTRKRFVALTGNGAQGFAGLDCTDALQGIVDAYFAPSVAQNEFEGWTDAPVEGWAGPEDDEELIRKARASGQRSAAAAFGGDGGVTFEDLWTANADALARKWPESGGKVRPYDASHADQALANQLAYWTGKNCERMERLMRRSALAREKWDTHRSFMTLTVLAACRFMNKVYSGRQQPALAVAPTPPEDLENAAQAVGRAVRAPGREYMLPVEQLEHFKGCYFLADSARIYDLNRNKIMSKAAFDVVHGGHLFVLDPQNTKTTTSAWDAFTLSRVNFPMIVDDVCFRPRHKPGELVPAGAQVLVNSFVPYEPARLEGDAGPFLDMMVRAYPNDRDRLILLHYFSAMAQYPGRKFQWWPVLQGAEGTGKTMIIEAVRFTVGEHYSHAPNTAKLAKQGINFNAWLKRRLFIAFEEIKCGNNRDLLEELKPLVTNSLTSLESKGVDEITTDNAANGIMATNHKNGVPVTFDTRRYGMFFSPLQTRDDVLRAGLTNDYWGNLWDWFRGEGDYTQFGAFYGARILANFFKTFQLQAELDPTRGLAARAPETSSLAEAVEASRGSLEQEVLEAVAEGLPGFAGGWISSCYLDDLIERKRFKVPRNARRDIMRDLGYVTHPALGVEGRVFDKVNPDSRKPVLYLRAGHLSLNLQSGGAVAKAYSEAQQNAVTGRTAAAEAFA